MGSFLDKPKTDKSNQYGDGNGLKFAIASMQGWRIEMEDAHCAEVKVPGFEDWSFFAIFDGHAGAKVSQYCSQHLLDYILKAESSHTETNSSTTTSQNNNNNTTTKSLNKSNSSNSLNNSSSINNSNNGINSNSSSPNSPNPNSNLINNNSNSLSNNVNNSNNDNNQTNSTFIEKMRTAIVKGFLDLDEAIRKLPEFSNGDDKSGSTAVACLISPHNVYLINCGDSRSILVSENKVTLATCDHKPVNPEERDRIQKAGGSVMIQRVNGSLAVSRALGDFEYKMVDGMGPTEQLVSPEPEIYVCERSPKDEFIVLACDGIWDVMTNEDIKDYIRARLKVTDHLVQITNDVLDTCLYKGSRDNMSIIIVTFPGALKPIQDEIEKDKQLNDKLEAKIKELVSTNNPKPDLSTILNSLSNENWENLPPGGGLSSKQAFIEDIYFALTRECDNNESDFSNSPS